MKKNLLTLILCSLISLSFFSCGSDDDDKATPGAVTVEVIASDNILVDYIAIVADGSVETITADAGDGWSKSYNIKAAISAGVKGTAASGTVGTLEIRLKDSKGKIIDSKEATSAPYYASVILYR